jgi:hypothetical protein
MNNSALALLIALMLVFSASVFPVLSAKAQNPVHVYSLLINGVREGGDNAEHVTNDVLHLKDALDKDIRPHTIKAYRVDNFGQYLLATRLFDMADSNDICIFYLGTHGLQVPDRSPLDESDNLDGVLEIGRDDIRDDILDEVFKRLSREGKCGGGMILFFLACHSAELRFGTADLFLPFKHAIFTSCLSPEESGAGMVGGHEHSLFGGALVRGLSDTNNDGIAEADTNKDKKVKTFELSTWTVFEDNDPGATPNGDGTGQTIILDYTGTTAVEHGNEVVVDDGGLMCSVDLSGPTPPVPPTPPEPLSALEAEYGEPTELTVSEVIPAQPTLTDPGVVYYATTIPLLLTKPQ